MGTAKSAPYGIREAAALTQMTITMIANQSRRMAGDCFIVATLSAERGDPRQPRCSSVIAQS
jgi:hypothetical protein